MKTIIAVRKIPFIEFTPIKIKIQGGIELSKPYSAAILSKHNDIVLLEISLKNKYSEFSHYCGGDFCGLGLIGNANTLYEKEKLKGEITEIAFPEFAKWSVRIAGVCKYNLTVVLTNH